MNNLDITINSTMHIMVNSFAPVVVQHAVAPVMVRRSFQAVVVHRALPNKAKHLHVPKARIRAGAQRRSRIRRVARAPRPRARQVARSRPSTSRSSDSPPGPSHPLIGGAS